MHSGTYQVLVRLRTPFHFRFASSAAWETLGLVRQFWARGGWVWMGSGNWDFKHPDGSDNTISLLLRPWPSGGQRSQLPVSPGLYD